jgi:hypothetical protein
MFNDNINKYGVYIIFDNNTTIIELLLLDDYNKYNILMGH